MIAPFSAICVTRLHACFLLDCVNDGLQCTVARPLRGSHRFVKLFTGTTVRAEQDRMRRVDGHRHVLLHEKSSGSQTPDLGAATVRTLLHDLLLVLGGVRLCGPPRFFVLFFKFWCDQLLLWDKDTRVQGCPMSSNSEFSHGMFILTGRALFCKFWCDQLLQIYASPRRLCDSPRFFVLFFKFWCDQVLLWAKDT